MANVKISPQVNVNVDYLKNVEKLLKELKQEQSKHDDVDIERILKELQKPKNAIAVRLTKKDEDEFYNAILSVISGGGGGGNVTNTLVEKNFAVRVQDDAGDSNIQYIGNADIGSLTNKPVWQIMKVDKTTGTIITWADGNDNFDNIYNDRESINYS